MRAFYNTDGEVMGYVESDHEDGFTIEGMTYQSVDPSEMQKVKDKLKAKKNLKGPKDIKPPHPVKEDKPEPPTVTPHPKV